MLFKKIKFDYDLNTFLSGDFTQHYGSCISYQRREQTDIHETVGDGSLPESYHEDNTRIQQIWWEPSDIDYKEIGEQLDIDVKTISAILQPPGNTVTLHRDTFFKFKTLYPDDDRLKVRANIFLEDWKVGHFIQYEDTNGEWINYTHWKAGDGLLWDSTPRHLSCNAGLHDKYSLQVSGFWNGKSNW